MKVRATYRKVFCLPDDADIDTVWGTALEYGGEAQLVAINCALSSPEGQTEERMQEEQEEQVESILIT